MKTAPHFIVGLTACAASLAGMLLAAEDPALFDTQQATFLMLADGINGADHGGNAAMPREESFEAVLPTTQH